MSMAGGGRATTVTGQSADINITPYIDILLVLLIIFMVIQPTTQYDLEARVPEKADEVLPDDVILQTDNIVVTIAADGTYAINQEPVPFSQLQARLFDIYSARKNKNMFIQGAGELPFGDVVRVIDVAKGAGVQDVGLMIEGAS